MSDFYYFYLFILQLQTTFDKEKGKKPKCFKHVFNLDLVGLHYFCIYFALTYILFCFRSIITLLSCYLYRSYCGALRKIELSH